MSSSGSSLHSDVGSLGRLGEVESIDGRLMELPSLNASVTDAGTNRWSPATASTIFENIGGGLQRSIGHNERFARAASGCALP